MSAYWINFDEEDSNHINQENKKSVKNQPPKKKKTTCIGGRVGGKEKCITSYDIKNKLEAANKRREEQNLKRSQDAVKSRENMIALALKIEKLKTHDTAKQKIKSSAKNNILGKKEYCKIAAEVSFEFESLSKKYGKDLLDTTASSRIKP